MSTIGVVLALLLAAGAGGQTLTPRGQQFAVDGRPDFLVFASYFDGVRRVPAHDHGATATLDADLAYLVSKGVDGVRVWPNTPQSPAETLMQCDGTLRATELARLRTLVDRAARRSVVVDLSFTMEHVLDPAAHGGRRCLTLETFRAGLAAAATALAGRGNVLFDLQNEWNAQTSFTAADLRGLRDAVKTADPARVVTASTSGFDADAASAFFKQAELDVLAFHEPRRRGWEVDTAALVTALRARLEAAPPRLAPVYLQEPSRCGYHDCEPAHYWTAAANAKRAGAAAWTFHSDPARDLGGASSFESLLLPSERVVLDGLRAALDATPWGVR